MKGRKCAQKAKEPGKKLSWHSMICWAWSESFRSMNCWIPAFQHLIRVTINLNPISTNDCFAEIQRRLCRWNRTLAFLVRTDPPRRRKLSEAKGRGFDPRQPRQNGLAPEALRASPVRGRRRWPGRAGSTASAGVFAVLDVAPWGALAALGPCFYFLRLLRPFCVFCVRIPRTQPLSAPHPGGLGVLPNR
jgi:hypothetical protein